MDVRGYDHPRIPDHMKWRGSSVLEGFGSSSLESFVHISGKP